MRRLSSNALPGIMLVIVIFWALFAVVLLTGIISTANRIENRVGVINSAVTPINSKLDTVAVLTNVQNTASQIRDAAAPLTGIIGNVVNSASSIDNSAKTILGSAQSINGSVKTINASVLEINKSVKSIAPAVDSILVSAQSINASVNKIGPNFVQVVDLVYDIKTRIVLASAQVDDIIRSVNGILGDLDSVGVQVDLINNNAQGISSSPLIMNSGNAGVMSEMTKASAGQGPAPQSGLPAFDLLPSVPLLGLPAPLPLPSTEQLPLDVGKLLQGLPLLSDAGNVLGLVGAAPK
ncbi:MAG TPA: hypothetical protein VJT72_03445 [Pseudonocardiaceae bacterium]|nr:hypothetical protein [Pseudonocardiaceae bacterium]